MEASAAHLFLEPDPVESVFIFIKADQAVYLLAQVGGAWEPTKMKLHGNVLQPDSNCCLGIALD